jgi:hypothetical protein
MLRGVGRGGGILGIAVILGVRFPRFVAGAGKGRILWGARLGLSWVGRTIDQHRGRPRGTERNRGFVLVAGRGLTLVVVLRGGAPAQAGRVRVRVSGDPAGSFGALSLGDRDLPMRGGVDRRSRACLSPLGGMTASIGARSRDCIVADMASVIAASSSAKARMAGLCTPPWGAGGAPWRAHRLIPCRTSVGAL